MYGGLPSGNFGGIIVFLVWGCIAIGVGRIFEYYGFKNWMGWIIILSFFTTPIPPLAILALLLAVRGARRR